MDSLTAYWAQRQVWPCDATPCALLDDSYDDNVAANGLSLMRSGLAKPDKLLFACFKNGPTLGTAGLPRLKHVFQRELQDSPARSGWRR